MGNDKALLRINLLEAFKRLLETLETFCVVLRRDQSLPVWVWRSDEERAAGTSPRHKALDLYRALWYQDGQDGRGTQTCPGIVGSSSATLQAAIDCNTAKDSFKAAVIALKNLPKSDANALLIDLHKRNEEVALAMHRMGAARLNLKQAYRHIPLLRTRPAKIGFTWSKQGRVIQRTTVDEARRLLERRRPTLQVQRDLERLQGIPETEMLARVRRICPHLRANVVFDGPVDGVERRLLQTPLPILVLLTLGQTLPEFVPISPDPVGSLRLQRSDVRIEEESLLPSIRVHRYRELYREIQVTSVKSGNRDGNLA